MVSGYTCKTCYETKPLSEFYHWNKSHCKKCESKRVMAAQKRNPQVLKRAYQSYAVRHRTKISEKRRQKYLSGCEKRSVNYNIVNRAWHMANPEKVLAKAAVRYAIKTGKLVRPSICSLCASQGPIVAHHEDYSKRLDVQWVCASCHRLIHSPLPHKLRFA